jgi:NitT/TauT family transport system ATP-binding protein
MSTSTPAPGGLSLTGITYRYPGSDRDVLREVSLSIDPGETVCVLGASGCGKTTLLKIAASLVEPDAGTIALAGAPVRRPGPERIVVFQEQDQLFPWKTVLGNTIFPQRYLPSPPPRDVQRKNALNALGEVELIDADGMFPHQLSGGMRQRAALARAIAMEPAVLLLDEPFAAVDAPTRERLGELLLTLRNRHNPGILFVTHDVDEALRLGDRLLVLGRDGSLRYEGDVPVADADPSVRDALRRRVRSLIDDV